VRRDALEASIAGLGERDRFQASAELSNFTLAMAAQLAALGDSSDVHVHHFPAGPGVQYLGFDAPHAWGVVHGRISWQGVTGRLLSLDHGHSPLCVATYSRASQGRARVVDAGAAHASWRGALVLASGSRAELTRLLPQLASQGALGVLTDAFAKRIGERELRGRLELAPGSPLSGFSLLPSEATLLRDALGKGVVHAEIDLCTEHEASVPVLVYRTDPTATNELWLTAHSCHPRPGANDNGSGIACVLELCRLLAELGQRGSAPPPALRVVMGPEFVGVAAYLSHLEERGELERARPAFVVNVDTVGGAPDRTGAELFLEHAPLYMARDAQQQLAAQLASLEGASGLALRPTRFCGYSDHALFAALRIDVPAVQICQTGDVFNHTDGDRLENLSFDQIAWICAALSGFALQFRPLRRASHRADGPPRSAGLPFNFRALLAKLLDSERAALLGSFHEQKETYAVLQKIWLYQQRMNEHELRKLLQLEYASLPFFEPALDTWIEQCARVGHPWEASS